MLTEEKAKIPEEHHRQPTEKKLSVNLSWSWVYLVPNNTHIRQSIVDTHVVDLETYMTKMSNFSRYD